MTDRDPRPDHTTIVRWPSGVVAEAKIPGPCTGCGGWIYPGDMIRLEGAALVGEVGARRVDLSEAEWVHHDVCPDETSVEESALVAAYSHGGRELAANLQDRFEGAAA